MAIPILIVLVIPGALITGWNMIGFGIQVGLALLGLFVVIYLMFGVLYRHGFPAAYQLSEGGGVVLRPGKPGMVTLLVGSLFGLAQDNQRDRT
jgi:hypothetical protein